MKKNYVKPSLLSETFVAENIMSGETEVTKNILSANIDLYMGGQKFTGITFADGNTLNTVNINSFNQ